MIKKLIAIFVLLILGCSSEINRDQIPGRYEFVLNDVRQVIIINNDGTYKNKFYKDEYEMWADQGTWVYEVHNQKNGITLNRFRFGITGYNLQPGFWFVVPSKSIRGSKELCFDPDLNRCFKSPN